MSSCVDPDLVQKARVAGGDSAVHDLVVQAVRPLAENTELRRRLLEIRRAHDVYWDEVNRDKLLQAAGQDPRVRLPRL